MYEYIPYKPEVNKAEVVQIEPVNNNAIDEALKIMAEAQLKPEPEAPEPEAPEPEAPEPEAPEPEAPELKNKICFKHNAILFKRIFNLLGAINQEAKLKFNIDSIKTSIVDPAHVCMINLEIPKYALEKYSISNDINLGFDIDKLQYLLKNIGKNDLFEFNYNSDIDLLKTFIDIGLFNHEYSLIEEINLLEPTIPNLNLPVNFKINTKIVYDFLIQASKITDYIQIDASRDQLIFTGSGDSDKVVLKLNREQINRYICNNNYKSCFSVEYLLKVIKNLKPLFTELNFYMGNENPISIIGNQSIRIEVLLAPRIETE